MQLKHLMRCYKTMSDGIQFVLAAVGLAILLDWATGATLLVAIDNWLISMHYMAATSSAP